MEGALYAIYRFLPWGWIRLLPLLLIPVIAAWGFFRLFDRRPLPALAATVMFVVNPFTYERTAAGQAAQQQEPAGHFGARRAGGAAGLGADGLLAGDVLARLAVGVVAQRRDGLLA